MYANKETRTTNNINKSKKIIKREQREFTTKSIQQHTKHHVLFYQINKRGEEQDTTPREQSRRYHTERTPMGEIG